MLLFDTGKKLEKAVGEEAAQIIIEALEKISEEQKREAATKGDVREAELRLQAEIKQAKFDMLKWQIGGFVAMAAIMAKGFGWIGF